MFKWIVRIGAALVAAIAGVLMDRGAIAIGEEHAKKHSPDDNSDIAAAAGGDGNDGNDGETPADGVNDPAGNEDPGSES